MFKKKPVRSAAALLLMLTLAAPLVAAVSAVPVQEVLAVAQTSAPAPVPSQEPVTLYPIRVDGEAMTEDPMITDVNGETYVAVRPVALALDADIQTYWDGASATFYHTGVLTLYATPGMNYVEANGRPLYVTNQVAARDGAILLPLETVCKIFDATCVSQPDGSFDLTSGSGALLSAEEFYDADDLYWLSHIINAESGNQPMSGKIAVGNVILNRVQDSRFPSSIYSVVFQKNQFTPAATGSINKAPNADSVLAAKLCLDGAVALDNVLYFNQTGLRCWAAKNRPFVATIAGHNFYS